MKDIVTFETAKRLRDAGFPQPGYPVPDPADVMGRVMYDADGDKFMCFWQEEDGGGVISLTPFMNNKQDCKNPLVFAPSATDILRELPDGHTLVKFSQNLFVCTNNNTVQTGLNYIISDNPAESAAGEWIRINSEE